jgi:hypothetical protein
LISRKRPQTIHYVRANTKVAKLLSHFHKLARRAPPTFHNANVKSHVTETQESLADGNLHRDIHKGHMSIRQNSYMDLCCIFSLFNNIIRKKNHGVRVGVGMLPAAE